MTQDKTQNETALHISNGETRFVDENGEYQKKFPRENIVRRSEEDSFFVVYGFVGNHRDFEEQTIAFEEEDEAVEYATDLYGQQNPDGFEKDGEVFEVEIHEIDENEAVPHFKTAELI